MAKSMSRIGTLCLLAAAIASLGAASDPTVRTSRITVPQNANVGGGLRGPQTFAASPAPPLSATAAPAQTRPSLAALATSRLATDAGECRMACARPYYFCLAGQEQASCTDAWSRCIVTCDSPGAQVETSAAAATPSTAP